MSDQPAKILQRLNEWDQAKLATLLCFVCLAGSLIAHHIRDGAKDEHMQAMQQRLNEEQQIRAAHYEQIQTLLRQDRDQEARLVAVFEKILTVYEARK